MCRLWSRSAWMVVGCVVVLVLAVPAYFQEPMPWDEGRQATWDDFQGDPPDGACPGLAEINTELMLTNFTYELCQDAATDLWKARLVHGPDATRVIAVMHPAESWACPDVRDNPVLLEHERGHFDLAEVYSRLYNEALDSHEWCERGATRDEAAENLHQRLVTDLGLNVTLTVEVVHEDYDDDTHGKDEIVDEELQRAASQRVRDWLADPSDAPSLSYEPPDPCDCLCTEVTLLFEWWDEITVYPWHDDPTYEVRRAETYIHEVDGPQRICVVHEELPMYEGNKYESSSHYRGEIPLTLVAEAPSTSIGDGLVVYEDVVLSIPRQLAPPPVYDECSRVYEGVPCNLSDVRPSVDGEVRVQLEISGAVGEDIRLHMDLTVVPEFVRTLVCPLQSYEESLRAHLESTMKVLYPELFDGEGLRTWRAEVADGACFRETIIGIHEDRRSLELSGDTELKALLQLRTLMELRRGENREWTVVPAGQ